MVSLLIGAARACANVAVRALHRHRRHSARVLKHFLDPLSLQLLCMSYHLRSGAVPCLGSKQSLANALHSRTCHRSSPHLRASRTAVVVLALQKTRVVRGKCYVTKDNIDTDQIIPAEYLTLVPSKKDEYEKLGSYALIGLPTELYKTRFIKEGEMKAEYPIVIGGENFGCGSSREHAPVCMGAAGTKMVVSQSYARIFFRNCVSTGEIYPVETDERLCDILETGQEVEVDLEKDVLTDLASGKQYPLKSIGEAGPVVDAGGIFAYARETGMIKKAATA